jgi:uncharacterized protein
MICPRCKNELNKRTMMDFKYFINVDHCSSCGGIWFDNGELARLEKTIEPKFVEFRTIPDQHDQMDILSCPYCNVRQVLQKAEHPRDKKVIIDYCPECKGIWLDGGELKAIREENWMITLGRFFNWLVSKEQSQV